ncbi:MAG TPA: CHAD domain-containing protein [Ktedonobacteraceae bacterium]
MAKAKAITYLDAQAPVAVNARLIARERLAELYQWEQAVDDTANVRGLHDMRIAAKRLRYTFEVFEEVLPAASKKIVSELTRLQDELGALHDSDVMIALLQMRIRLSDGRSDTAAEDGTGANLLSSDTKPLITADMAAYLLGPRTVPTEEQRRGLEEFLRQQEDLRGQRYNTFRQHWRQLQERDFRREVLDMLGE